jgi:hypothetical protein
MLAIVAPYFGTLPAHTQLWLNSLAANPQVTWLLYTDDRTAWDYPGNVRVTYCTLDDLSERFQRKFDFEIALPGIRKLGDYKPLYGYLFEEELAGYLAWGHVDVGDVIYGDISKFITPERIEAYDRLGRLGHMTIYRNTPENNRRFMAESGAGFGYREVFSNPDFMNFEEVAPGSIDEIWRHNGWTTGEIDADVADLRAYSWDFRISRGYGTEHHEILDNRGLVFEWDDGDLWGHELDPRGEVASREYLYVHFKRRKMPMAQGLDQRRYLIAPEGFLPAPVSVDAACLKRLGKRRFPDPMWMAAKKAGLKRRFGR